MTHTVAHMQTRADSCGHILYVHTYAIIFAPRALGTGFEEGKGGVEV